MNKIKIVEEGYNKVYKWYRGQRNSELTKNYLFNQFLNFKGNNEILELGCGSGFPFGEELLKHNKKYIGVDLSEEQIQLAKNQYPEFYNSFVKEEMIKYCESKPDESFTGIFSLFSIRHIPRVLHASLYSEIYRILKPGGILLIDCTEEPHDGVDKWSNNNELMYWSGFSKEWTIQTLNDLGFKLLDSFYDEKQFDGEKERTLFLLYLK